MQLPSVTLASVTQLVLIYPCVPAFLPWVGVTYLRVGVTYPRVGVTHLRVGVTYPWVGVTYPQVGVTYLWVGVTYLRGCSGKLFLLTA